MPILAAEPQHFPPELFQERSDELYRQRSWWVLHTKPRQEKSLARTLYASQIPFYLPLTVNRQVIRNRVVYSHLPLFASYLFLLASAEERVQALATARIVSCLQVHQQKQLMRDLIQVSRLMGLGSPVTSHDQMMPGTSVEIKSGPLMGMRGKIIQEASRKRFVVEVDFIHRGASVLLDGTSLIPA